VLKSKNNRIKKISNFLIFYAFIILFLCFKMTLSKYTLIGNAQTTVSMAAWKIKVNSENLEATNKFILNNIQTLSNAQTVANKIAPNSKGYFDIILDIEDTEVSVDYKLELDTNKIISKGIDLKLTGYSINDGDIKTIENNTISRNNIS